MIQLEWLSGFNRGQRHNLSLLPAPAIMAGGLGGSGHGQYHLIDDGISEQEMNMSKPEYRVPLMAEIAAGKTCGLKVVDTFSGGGGSSTGFKLAGFDMLLANEFVPSAQESYRANHPGTILDCRDIKLVTAEEILAAIGLKVGELDIFSGSPPCQAFSTAGKREKGWAANGGAGKKYEGGETQHNELLFFEYVRLLKGLQPKMFIAENVKGLTMGAAKKMMGDAQLDAFDAQDDTILHALMDAGYVVRWQVLDAKHYGVPQTRNRVIFIGLRNDLAKKHKLEPVFPPKLPYVYTVRDAIPWITRVLHETGGQFSGGDETNRPAFAVNCSPGQHKVIEGELPAELQLPPSRLKEGAYGEIVNPDKPCPTVTCASPGNDLQVPTVIKIDNAHFKQQPGKTFPRGKEFSVDEPGPSVQANGMYGAPADTIKIVQQQGGTFNAEVSTEKPLPCVCSSQPNQFVIHEKAADEKVEVIMGNEKFKPIFGDPASGPCPTIMAGGPHGGSGLVQVTKAEAGEVKTTKRKFTIAEVKRICSFPDDYILAGSYAKQWERLGNSVPPVMMQHIAAHLRDNIFAKIQKLKWHARPAYVAPVIPKQEPQPEPVMETKTKKKAKAKGEPQPKLTAAPEPVKAKPESPAAPPAPVEPPKPKITGKFEMADYWKNRFK